MEDTYTVLQVIARSWGAMFMLLFFLGVIIFHAASRQQAGSTATPRISPSVTMTAR